MAIGRAKIVTFHQTCHETAAKGDNDGGCWRRRQQLRRRPCRRRAFDHCRRPPALTDPELSDPEAVHEVRKALKRWRALLRLLGRPLGEQADQMRSEARELMRGDRRRARRPIGARCIGRSAQGRPAIFADLDRNDPRAADRNAGRGRSEELHQDDARPAVALSRLRNAFARALAAQGDRFRYCHRRTDVDLSARAPTGA